ncbi:MAG TPA: hypothetical protein VM535_02110 [Candidatus Saccharimonadales bacterium]|nr:hypothetical protein [Candidatus Saccharimonadales bacterium]
MNYGYSERDHTMKALFGNKDRIDVAAAVMRFSVDPPETFRGIEVSNAVLRDKGVSGNVARQQLKVFESVNMLEEVNLESRAPGDVAYYYRRVDSPLWRVVEVAVEVMDELYPNSEA